MTPDRHFIDWQALHARLSLAEKAIASTRERSLESQKAILEERASFHARRVPEIDAKRERLEVVEFRLAHEMYAIDCGRVIEVAPLGEYAPLPGAPEFLLGVTSLRGRMVSVVDLGRLFGLPSSGLTDRNRVLVLNGEGMEIGLLADAVDSVKDTFIDQLTPPLPTLTGVRGRLCRGILPGGRMLLDSRNLLSERAFFGELPRNPQEAELTLRAVQP